MNEVVDYGSCCECGSCVLVCPHNVIEYIGGKPQQTAKPTAAFDFCGISEGIGCDVCAQVCPRLYPREFQLVDLLYGKDQPPYSGAFGRYRKILAARSSDPEIHRRGQDGGVVTGILAWGLRSGFLDGAVLAAIEPDRPCFPVPKAIASVEEVIASAGSWYTYVPNNLAMAEAQEKGLREVAFVGVPCQITPVRKMQLKDPGYLNNGRKKEKHIERQSGCLKGFATRVKLNIGLLCSEVFTFQGLMVEKIEGEMGIPLSEIRQFNVKGKVQIYKKSGELVELGLRKAQEYARPECHHCGDFSGELADISCGGVGTHNWTIVVVRTRRGEEVIEAMVRDGLLELRSMDEFESSMKVLIRLARRQRARVPVPPGRDESFVRLPEEKRA